MQRVTIKKLISRWLLLGMGCFLLLGAFAAVLADDSTGGPTDVITFLNQTILWYRQLGAEQALANQPSDVIFLNDNRQMADQVVQLSFEFARARAQATGSAATHANLGIGLRRPFALSIAFCNWRTRPTSR